MASAAEAAGELAAALAEVAARLRPAPPGEGPDAPPPGEGGAPGGRRRPAPPPTRRPAPLPGGLHDDSVEAAEHLVRLPRAALLVDGYNASMATWPDLDLVAQRRRLVAALTELEARCGPEVVVVFDGVDDGSAHPARPARRVRVEFTPGAVEADDVLIARAASLPAGRPVVVVSDDHRVRDGARAAGANLVGTAQLQALIGRSRR
ncbi:NYN domain-containing protein [Iamia majanohamensis]|uniref:NYN domain-containing protein n=1 Tax=Iamia majanohamensis TaxID=467976 RepID=A0AAE9Y3W3_9ACTN|nr:NYN domain-containing protein [Iamia majanohamensis]WCO65644.1 NYN domain-containing protein [Iamia majanohamensis]